MSTMTITIAGNAVTIREGTFKFTGQVDQQDRCVFTVIDTAGTASFSKRQPVTVADSVQGTLFTGYVNKAKAQNLYPNAHRTWQIDCSDQMELPKKRTSNKVYANQYSGTIFADQVKRYLTAENVTGPFALDWSELQTDFAAGTLTNVVAATNYHDANSGDGDLELASAGTTATYTDGNFSPTSSPVIWLQGTAVAGVSNNYSYRKIWAGNITIANGDFLSYDMWVSSTSPQIWSGVDFVCTDGTTFRDSPLAGTDSQGIGPHPKNDTNGLSNDQWYSRQFGVSGSLIGKTISYVTVAFEGDNPGNYNTYFKNIVWHSSVNTNIFTTTLQTNVQMQNNGYANVLLSVVTGYLNNAQNIATHSIDAAKIVRSSFIDWVAVTPGTTAVKVETSIDNGASWQLATLNGAIPNLLPGMSVASRTVQIRRTLLLGTDPTLPPSFTSTTMAVQPSYNATKADAISTTSTQTNFNLGTLTNTMSPTAGGVTLNGFTRNWDNADYSNQTMFGSSSPFQAILNKQFYLSTFSGTDVKTRLDFAGQWQNFTAEVDIQVQSNFTLGFCYRTTNWGNSNDSEAYTLVLSTTLMTFGKGNNSTGAGSNTNILTAPLALTAGTWHRLKIVINGTTHQAYLDDVLYINTTDTSYNFSMPNAGYIGLRMYNNSGAVQNGYFDNFGVCANLSGTWQSAPIPISGATTYGSSMVEWDTSQTPNTTTITAQTSINGGSTWQAITNGGSISGLTAGASLAGVNVLLLFTLTANNAPIQPTLGAVTVWVQGQFSASGTRISPSLSLAGVGRAGSSLVNWNALLPNGNTTIGVDTSIDSQATWQNIAAAGGTIPNINLQPQPIYDTFINNQANYLSTFGNGGSASAWAIDTANSRIAASGGSDGLYIRWDNRYAGLTLGVNPGIGQAGSPYPYWSLLFADMAAKGLSTLRFQLSWRNIELTQGNYTWTVLDDAVQQCNAAGIRLFYTIRVAPTWALDPANGAQLASSVPQYIMSPTMAAGFATQVATRYDGKHGHGVIDVLGFNEDFSIAHTSISDKLVLNGTVNAGVAITSFPITSSGFTPKAGSKVYFGTFGSTDIATVSVDVQLTDTAVNCYSFAPASTYTATQSLQIGYVGIYNSPYPGLYGSANTVTSSNKTEPARDFHFAAPVYTAVYNAIRAVNATIPIGLPVIWWTQPVNAGTPNTPVSNYTASLQTLYTAGVPMDAQTFIDFHYYTNPVDPATGNNQCSSINQAMIDMAAVASSNGDAGRQIICTEFGWQANQSTTSSTTIAAGTRTITLANTNGAAVGGNVLVDTVGSGVQETVAITAKTSTTITGVFVNAHTATYPVVILLDCPPTGTGTTGQDGRYNYVMGAIQSASAKNQFFFYTLDYSTSGPQTSSLVLYNGSAYVYQPAWTNVGNYITSNPGGSSINTATDVDEYVDMDTSDAGGMVWRYVDSNNFYELVVRDGSSPTNPNTVQIYKMASGTRSAIGPTNPTITFARGTYKRFRVTMFGGVITVYMDNVQIATYTDGSPLAGGKCGLRNDTVSGSSASRYYSFRMQPQGDDVTSKTVYTRTRLNSTDPTATPALLDMQTFVSSPAIGSGILIPSVSYVNTYVSNNLLDLNTQSNYWWSIDLNKKASFQARNAVPAPWILQSSDVLVQGLLLENSADLYRNRQVLTGVQSTQVFSKNFTGDGTSTSWTLDYPVAKGTIPTILLDNQPQSIGVQGVDTGKQFYYTPGSTGITADNATPILLKADTLAVSYTGALITSVTRNNTSFPGTVTQSMMATIDGSSGIVEQVTDVTALNLNVAAAQVYGDQLLQRYGTIGRTLSFRTLRTGLAYGQQITAFVPEQGCSDVQFLVTQVDTTITTGAGGNLQYWYAVIAMEGPNLGNWVRLFSSSLKG